MIVYSATKSEFINHVRFNRIENIIQKAVLEKIGRRTPISEINSWKNSLDYMFRILIDEGIPGAAGVAIEYNIPLTNRRVDFILTGKSPDKKDAAVIIELKQWSEAEVTEKDAIIQTFIGGGVRETNHPSYQAWSYAALIEDYNETVREEEIFLQPCAYLHNMESGDAVNDARYRHHTDKAPVFISSDAQALASFLKKYIRYGDSSDIMYRIEHGVIKPSKTLADSLASMMNGNREFILLDEQKLVYETALKIAESARESPKKTLIVKGGPGTGKSVVAINILVEAIKREMLAQYVTKNAAPRDVFKSMLTGSRKKTHIDNLFRGSGGYTDTSNNFFDLLVIDEAHRLNEKSGLYGNLGENQIKELIVSSKATIFFIDEDQRVTLSDIGTVQAIKEFCESQGSEVTILELASQFRCNGSDGYLAWVDSSLQIRETANEALAGIEYDFRVFDNPNDLRSEIVRKNIPANKSRMVAGYCWNWESKKNPDAFDIIFPDYEFRARWNLTKHGGLWLVSEDSIDEVGCIHTCQGLDLEYVGVIFGDDFVIRDGVAITNAGNRASTDRSVRGYKSLYKKDPHDARALADMIIKNTYRTLMTRGMKGCYIYCSDKETREYFTQLAAGVAQVSLPRTPFEGLPYPVFRSSEAKPYNGYVPVYDLVAASGEFGRAERDKDKKWVQLPDHFLTPEGHFVIQVIGESMNKRIPNGAWCLFRESPEGDRSGKIVLVEHPDIDDPDHGGSYTVRRCHSEKMVADSRGLYAIKRHRGDKAAEDKGTVRGSVILSSETTAFGYSDLTFDEASAQDLRVIGELVAILA